MSGTATKIAKFVNALRSRAEAAEGEDCSRLLRLADFLERGSSIAAIERNPQLDASIRNLAEVLERLGSTPWPTAENGAEVDAVLGPLELEKGA